MIKISSSPLLKILYLLSFEIQEKRDGHSSKIIPLEVDVLFQFSINCVSYFTAKKWTKKRTHFRVVTKSTYL